MRKSHIIFIIALFLINIYIVTATGVHETSFEQAENVIKQKIPCEDLSLGQLEVLGDYYMEQMHPGELHEVMDERMGGEGSASLRQAHINMGRAFYCGEHGAMSGGMMDMMMGRNMMGANGMGMINGGNTMGNSYYGNGYSIFSWIFMILVIIVIILFILWLIKKIQIPHQIRRRRR